MTATAITLISALGVNATPVTDLTQGEDERLFALFEAVRANKADVSVNDEGVLTATLSKRSVRAVRRAQKAQRLAGLASAIKASLQVKRPQKIGPIVTELAAAQGITDKDGIQKFRGDVLEACRSLRDDGVVVGVNTTGSNFHLQWDLAGEVSPWPPAPEPANEAEVSSEVESSEE